jgi:hypothetical protein
MMVMVMMPTAIVMMVVVMVPLGELNAALFGACALLHVQRFEPRAGIRDRLQQFGIGVGGEHVSRRRRRRGLCGPQGSERGHRSQKSGHLLVQSDLSLICPRDKLRVRSLVPRRTCRSENSRRLRLACHAMHFKFEMSLALGSFEAVGAPRMIEPSISIRLPRNVIQT